MSDWNVEQINQLGRVVTGKTPPKTRPDYYEGDELFVSPRDFDWNGGYVEKTQTTISQKALEAFKNQVLPQNAVLFTSLSFGFGKMAIASRRLLTNQQINSVIANDDHHFRFIYYLLRAYTPIIFSYNSGIDTPIVPKSVFEKVQVRCPELNVQRKIAAILTAYDDLIETNKRRIALLEKMAEELYREWFVRMRFPGHQNTKFVKGVPEGWPFDFGSAFFEHIKGKSYSSSEISQEDGECYFITLKSFHRRGGYRKQGLKFYSGSFKEDQCVETGDVVMAVTDMTQDRAVVGEVARIPSLPGKKAVISLDVMRLIPKEMSTAFLYAYMRHSGFAKYIKEFANGANVLHLKPDLVGKQRLLFPPKDLREKFSKLAEPIYQEAASLEEANAVLAQTRDLLLPRLISGKLPVEDLDIQFPPSMQKEAAEPAHA